MALKLLVFAVCVLGIQCCGDTSQNFGLMKNSFRNQGDNTLVMTNRSIDTNSGYAGSSGFTTLTFNNPINIMQDNSTNLKVTVCDNGILVFGASGTPTCPTTLGLSDAINASATNAHVIADFITETALVPFFVDVYHIRRDEQYDSQNLPIGPSICDLERIAAIIGDCFMDIRDMTIEEAAVVTWGFFFSVGWPATNKEYIFQTIVAVNSNQKTYIVFLYESTLTIPNGNGIAKGQIHAANGGLAGGATRVSEICNAVDEPNLELKGNCRCSNPGHFVFGTSELVNGTHGFCGSETGRDTCASQAALIDDSTNINRNCRNATKPTDTCDFTYSCTRTIQDELKIYFRDHNTNRFSYINYTSFTEGGGFSAPSSSNVQPILLDPGQTFGACTRIITPSTNSTFQSDTITVPNTCVEYDSATNTIRFAMLFWDTAAGVDVFTDNSNFVVGVCDLDNLPNEVNFTVPMGDVASTTVPARTGRSFNLVFWDQAMAGSTTRRFDSATTVSLGRFIYIVLIYKAGTPFERDVDPYGAYTHSCTLSNNPYHESGGENRTMEIVDSDGCKVRPNNTFPGFLYADFKEMTGANSTPPLSPDPFYYWGGPFSAFRWRVGDIGSAGFIYARCYVKLCRNTQLFGDSKCRMACGNTIVDANTTDVGNDRKKRQVEEDEEIVLDAVIEVVEEPSDITTPTTAVSKSECTDPVLAKSVIGALVALLFLATILTIILFCMLQNKRKVA